MREAYRVVRCTLRVTTCSCCPWSPHRRAEWAMALSRQTAKCQGSLHQYIELSAPQQVMCELFCCLLFSMFPVFLCSAGPHFSKFFLVNFLVLLTALMFPGGYIIVRAHTLALAKFFHRLFFISFLCYHVFYFVFYKALCHVYFALCVYNQMQAKVLIHVEKNGSRISRFHLFSHYLSFIK